MKGLNNFNKIKSNISLVSEQYKELVFLSLFRKCSNDNEISIKKNCKFCIVLEICQSIVYSV